MATTRSTRIIIRRDSIEAWLRDDPVLSAGEIGYEDGNPGRMKVGNGISPWTMLDYLAWQGPGGDRGPAGFTGEIGPAGATGTTGATGPQGTVAVGTVTTGDAGTSAIVTNAGSSSAAVFNFTIPRGAEGTGGTASVGTVTTGAAGTQASVSNTGTSANAVLNFVLPVGNTGSAASTDIVTEGATNKYFTNQRAIDALATALALKANLDSPILTGAPEATTAPAATNTNRIATTQFVRTEVAALVNSATSTLDTLGELAAALGNNASFSTTVAASIGLKAPLASPTFTGTVQGVTKAMVGLGNIDNTSDYNKPVSNATQVALNNIDSTIADHASLSASNSFYGEQYFEYYVYFNEVVYFQNTVNFYDGVTFSSTATFQGGASFAGSVAGLNSGHISNFDAAVTAVAAALPAAGLSITKVGDWTPSNPDPLFEFSPAVATQVGSTYTRYIGKFVKNVDYSEDRWVSPQTRVTSLVFNDLVGITQNLQLQSVNALTTLSFPQLAYIGNSCQPSTLNALTTLSFPALKFVGSSFNISSMPAMTSLTAPLLTHIRGNFGPNNMNALTTLSFPALKYTGSTISPYSMNALTTISLPALQTSVGGVSISFLGELTSFSVPAMISAGSGFSISSMAKLNAITATVLSVVWSSFTINLCALLPTINLPQLSYVGGPFTVQSSNTLATLNLPLLSYVGNTVTVINNPLLTSVTLGSFVGSVGTLKYLLNTAFNMSVNALTTASVTSILKAIAYLDGNNGTTLFNNTINISGGTNAIPDPASTAFLTGVIFTASGTTATATTPSAHGYAVNDVLQITGVTVSNFNRYARILTVPSVTTFTYDISAYTGSVTSAVAFRKQGTDVKALVTRGCTLTTNSS